MYKAAPADLYFTKSAVQDGVKREPIIEYTSVSPVRDTSFALVSLALLPLAWQLRRRRRPSSHVLR
jgi:hypothetical protein